MNNALLHRRGQASAALAALIALQWTVTAHAHTSPIGTDLFFEDAQVKAVDVANWDVGGETDLASRDYFSMFPPQDLALSALAAGAGSSQALYAHSVTPTRLSIETDAFAAQPQSVMSTTEADTNFGFNFFLSPARYLLTFSGVGSADFFSSSQLSFSLVGPGGVVWNRSLNWTQESDQDLYATIDSFLPEGEYYVESTSSASASQGGPADVSMRFSLAPVPEPSAWALLLGGLAALAWRRRARAAG